MLERRTETTRERHGNRVEASVRVIAVMPPKEALAMRVTQLYRYPVKGLSAEALASVELKSGETFPLDRQLAFLRTPAAFDRHQPRWLPKANFLMLMVHERLAQLKTRFDPEQRNLRIETATGTDEFAVDDAAARRELEALLREAAGDYAGTPQLVEAPAHHFMDKAENFVSLINLSSVEDLAQRIGQPVDPLRFRANIYIEGAHPWQEFDWIGRELQIGEVTFRVDRPNGRCSATNVDPATGQRNLDIPGTLRANFQHKDCGVYLLVTKPGRLQPGDLLQVLDGPAANTPSATASVKLATPAIERATGAERATAERATASTELGTSVERAGDAEWVPAERAAASTELATSAELATTEGAELAMTEGAELVASVKAMPAELVNPSPPWMCTACYYVLDRSRAPSRLADPPAAPGTFPLLDWVCPDCGVGAEFMRRMPRVLAHH